MQYVALVLSTMLAALAQFLLKLGVNQIDSEGKNVGQIVKAAVTNFYVWGGVLSYALNLSLWLYVLSRLELSKAYPMTSLAYVFALILGYFFLNENFTVAKMLGIGFIIIGIIFLSR